MPEADAQRNYQVNSIDRDRRDHMITCLIEGMKKFIVKPLNYRKAKEGQQGQDKNPAVFQGRLVEAFRKYTNVNPSSPQGTDPFGCAFHSPGSPRHEAQNSGMNNSDSNERFAPIGLFGFR